MKTEKPLLDLSKRKKILFSVVPSVALLALLVVAEVSLRWLWPDLTQSFLVQTTVGGVELLQTNRRYLAKYFPPSVPLIPELKSTLFRRQKLKSTFRIVCIGESSMFGTPYQMTTNIPGILRKQLRHLYPDRDFEVLNLGASAINSNVIANLAKEIPALEPDLVLLYAGHNEFYGPDGVGASFFEKKLPWLTGLKYNTKDLSLVVLLERTLLAKKEGTPHEYNLMRQVSQEFKVSLKSEDAERIFNLYEANLRKIIAILHDNNIQLIVSDVTSNLLFPPFWFDATESMMDELKSAERLEAHGKIKEALDILYRLLAKDSTNAGVNFSLGRVLYNHREIASARHSLIMARDNDLLKFRAPERTNEITRRICRNHRIPLISSDSLFVALSPLGIPGNNLFWEHLHPTAEGYYHIANLYLRKILDLQLIQPILGKSTLLPFDSDSLDLPWLDMAYADLSMQNLTRQWPFENYSVPSMVVDRNVDNELNNTITRVYRLQMGWEEGCLKSALRFHSLGQLRSAATTYKAMVEENPYDFYTLYLLGGVQRDLGELQMALQSYRASIGLKSDYPFSRIDLGLLHVNEGNFDEAINLLSSALPLTSPREHSAAQATAYYGLAAAYANKGEYGKALQLINESLTLAPDYEPAQKLKADFHREGH